MSTLVPCSRFRARLSRIALFFFNDPATTDIYTLSHTTLFRSQTGLSSSVTRRSSTPSRCSPAPFRADEGVDRSEEHTSELQSPDHLVCRLLLEKKKQTNYNPTDCRWPALQPLRRTQSPAAQCR